MTLKTSYRIKTRDLFFSVSPDFRIGLINDDIFDQDRELDGQRAERIKFHIKKGDYFGTLATILDIIAEDKHIDTEALLKKYVNDLLYLHKNYKIIKK